MVSLKDSKELLELSKEISNLLKGDKEEYLRLECSRRTGTYIATINVKGAFAKFASRLRSDKIILPSQGAYHLEVYSIAPRYSKIPNGGILNDNQIIIDVPSLLKSEVEVFRIELNYHMDSEWLEKLVHWRASPEPLKEAMKYHLSAQLIEPSSLAKGFREVDVEDYPLEARVHIQKDLSAGFPIIEAFEKIQELNVQRDKISDPHNLKEVMRNHQERQKLLKKLEREDPSKALKELLMLLNPQNFLDYVATDDKDFFIHNCEWGESLMKSAGSLSIPEMMKVITTTDLNLDKFASKGILTYKSRKLSDDASEIAKNFGIKK